MTVIEAPIRVAPPEPPEEETKPLSDAEILERAAEVIEKRGWTRGELEHRGRVCLIGAINVVIYGSPLQPGCPPATQRVIYQLEPIIGEESAAGWNDRQPSRKHVLRALRERAAALSK